MFIQNRDKLLNFWINGIVARELRPIAYWSWRMNLCKPFFPILLKISGLLPKKIVKFYRNHQFFEEEDRNLIGVWVELLKSIG